MKETLSQVVNRYGLTEGDSIVLANELIVVSPDVGQGLRLSGSDDYAQSATPVRVQLSSIPTGEYVRVIKGSSNQAYTAPTPIQRRTVTSSSFRNRLHEAVEAGALRVYRDDLNRILDVIASEAEKLGAH